MRRFGIEAESDMRPEAVGVRPRLVRQLWLRSNHCS